MGIDLLLAIWVVTWMVKTAAQDVAYAVTGKPNPRYELKKAKAAAAGRPASQKPRYGTRDWLSDLYSDALAANTEKRRKAATVKATPVDDMADVAGVRPTPARHPHDPNNTRNCPDCKGSVVVNGQPCQRCLAEQQRRNAEYERQNGEPEWLTPDPNEATDEPTTVVHDDQHPYCVEPCGPDCVRPAAANAWWHCRRCGELRDGFPNKAAAQADGAKHVCPKPTDTTNTKPTGPATPPADTQPLAPVIQLFPNTREINMPNANGEVTGLDPAISYAKALAQFAGEHGQAGNEGYIGFLTNSKVKGAGTQTAHEMQEAFTNAQAAAIRHARELEKQKTVQEAYDQNPDAGDKQFMQAGR